MGKIKRAVIIEDDVITAIDLECILHENNINEVRILNSAEKALESVSAFAPHVIFLDIALKGKSTGIDFAVEFRKASNTPIIVMSAYSERQFKSILEKIKPNFFLKKPFDESQVKKYLDRVADLIT